MTDIRTILAAHKAEVRRLLAHLKSKGHTLISVRDGEDERFTVATDGMDECLEAAVSCDEAILRIQAKDSFKTNLLIIHGNGPGELVADGSNPAGRIWDDIQQWSEQEQKIANRL